MASKAASLASMERDMEIAKTEALVHVDTMALYYNALAVLISLCEQLLNKIRGRGLGFQSKFKSEKQKTYDHLESHF